MIPAIQKLVMLVIIIGPIANAFDYTPYSSEDFKQCRESNRWEVTQKCCKHVAAERPCHRYYTSHQAHEQCKQQGREIIKQCCFEPAKNMCDERTAFDKYCYRVTLKNDASVILRAEVTDSFPGVQEYICDGKKKTDHNLTRGFTSNELAVSKHSFVTVYVVSTNLKAQIPNNGSGTITCTGLVIFGHVECTYPGGSAPVKLQ